MEWGAAGSAFMCRRKAATEGEISELQVMEQMLTARRAMLSREWMLKRDMSINTNKSIISFPIFFQPGRLRKKLI